MRYLLGDRYADTKLQSVMDAVGDNAVPFTIKSSLKYETTSWLGNKSDEAFAVHDFLANYEPLTKEHMSQILDRDNSLTREELLSNLIEVKSIEAKKAIAERVLNVQGEFNNKEGVIKWLNGISLGLPLDEKYNEIVENLIRAKVIGLDDAINIGWTNYSAINDLLKPEIEVKAGAEITLRRYDKEYIGINLEENDRDTTLLVFLAHESQITAETLQELINRGETITPKDIETAMLDCADPKKMNILVQKRLEVSKDPVPKEVADYLRSKPEFKAAMDLLMAEGKVVGTTEQRGWGRIIGWGASDLSERFAKGEYNVLAGMIASRALSGEELKIVNQQITKLPQDKFSKLFDEIKKQQSKGEVNFRNENLSKLTLSPLEIYINGKVNILKFLMDEKILIGEKINVVDGNGNNILHYAIANKQYELAKYLVQNSSTLGIDIYKKNQQGISPFTMLCTIKNSVQQKAIELVDAFIVADKEGIQAGRLFSVSMNSELALIAISNRELFLHIADKGGRDPNEFLQDLFNEACVKRDVVFVEKLIENYSDIIKPNEKISYIPDAKKRVVIHPLLYAYQNKDIGLFQILLKHNAIDVHAKFEDGKTLFERALIDGNSLFVEVLLSKIDLAGKDGKDAQQMVVQAIKNAIDKVAIDKTIGKDIDVDALLRVVQNPNFDLNFVDGKTGKSPILTLYEAIDQLDTELTKVTKDFEKLKFARDSKLAVDRMVDAFSEALHHPVDTYNRIGLPTVEKELQAKKEQLEKNKVKLDALFYAMFLRTDLEKIDLIPLLARNHKHVEIEAIFNSPEAAKINRDWLLKTDSKNGLPLISLIAMGNLEVCKKCLEKLGSEAAKDLKSNINDIDCIMAAAMSENYGVFNLIKTTVGAENIHFNRQDRYGNTLLHYAVKNQDIVSSILKAPGVNVDVQNKDGFTALAKAVIAGNKEVVKALMEAGADVNIPDKNGITPLMYAAFKGSSGIIEELLKDPRIDINAVNSKGVSAFMIAATYNAALKESTTAQPTADKKEAAGKQKPDKRELFRNDTLVHAIRDVDANAEWGKRNTDTLKLLIAHGALPTSGSRYDPVAFKLAEDIAFASIAAEATDFIGNTLKTAGAGTLFAPITNLFGAVFSYGRETLAIRAAWQVYSDTKDSVRTTFNQWLGEGAEIGFATDNIMVGSFSYGRFGRVISGDLLQASLEWHPVYEGKIAQGVPFTCKNYTAILVTNVDRNLLKDHESLVARYFAIESALKTAWLPWTAAALKALRAEVLEADKTLLQNKGYAISRENCEEFLNVLKGQNRDKLAYLMIKGDAKVTELSNVINSITRGEVLVPIEVLQAVYAFKDRQKVINKTYKEGLATELSNDLTQKIKLGITALHMEAVKQSKDAEVARVYPKVPEKKVEPESAISGKIKAVIQNVGAATAIVAAAGTAFVAYAGITKQDTSSVLSTIGNIGMGIWGAGVIGSAATAPIAAAASLAATLVAPVALPLAGAAVVGGALYYGAGALGTTEEGVAPMTILDEQSCEERSPALVVDFVQDNAKNVAAQCKVVGQDLASTEELNADISQAMGSPTIVDLEFKRIASAVMHTGDVSSPEIADMSGIKLPEQDKDKREEISAAGIEK